VLGQNQHYFLRNHRGKEPGAREAEENECGKGHGRRCFPK